MSKLTENRQQSEGRIDIAIQRLATKYPFHARILEQFSVLCSRTIDTMAVGLREKQLILLHNPEFVLELPMDQLTGVLLHEVHHVVFRHLLMQPDDYPDNWALIVAQEVTVNEFVMEPLPKGVITLELFPGLPPMESTERRYKRLLSHHERFDIGLPGTLPCKGQLGSPVDDHGLWAAATSDAFEGENIISEVVDTALSNVAHGELPDQLCRMAGLGTRDDEMLIVGALRGKTDWRQVLRRHLGQQLEVRPTFTRPPRRFPHMVGAWPGRRRGPNKKTDYGSH